MLALCLLSAWAAPAAWAANPPSATQSAGVLRVVGDENYPPYLFTDDDGRAQGYLVDLWALWERKTGVPVVLKAINWAQAQQMVLNGQADVIENIFRTPEREASYVFSAPYAELPVAIYAHQSISGIHSVDSLAGFRVGVMAGDACIEHLRSRGITDLVTFSNYQAVIDGAVGQQIKLFCMDQYPADHYLYRNQLHKDYPKAFDLYVGRFHRAAKRDNLAVMAQVEAGMALITAAEREELEKKWLRAPFDWLDTVRQSSAVLLGVLLVAGVLLLWVRSLRRAVAERTQDLVRERARLNAVIGAIPDLIWLKDPEGVYLGCNRAFEGLYGAAEAQIVGKTDRDFVDEPTAQAFRHHDLKAMAADKPSVNEEWLTFASDGRRRLFETVKTAMRDGRGELIGVLGVARDITERKHAAEELDRLRHHLQDVVTERTAQLQRTTDSLGQVLAEQTTLFAAAPVGIAVLRNRQVERCNPRMETIFGYEPGGMIGMPTRMWYVDEASYELMGRTYLGTMAGERTQQTILMRRRDGGVFWARVNAQAIDPTAPDKGLLAVIEDATAEHDASEALRLAQAQADIATRLKSAFLANISHEVRTPLNAILGMSHLAQEASDPDERREHLRHVQSAGQRLLRLFNDLLELSRFEAGQLQLSPTAFDLEATLQALLQVQAQRAAERRLALRLELAPDVPRQLVGDARRLSQLLMMYLDNAFKFTDKGEVRLEVSLKQRAPARVRLHFVVRDTGCGLSPTQKDALFGLFRQADDSLTRAHGGLGIGLSIVGQIARLMDGDVGVDSEPGQGSAFWFTVWLGLAADDAPHPQRLLRVPGRRALVASGQPARTEHLMSLLRGFGLSVEPAASGPEVLRQVHRAQQVGQDFDFVFLEADLPEVDGWRTAQMLAALESPQPLHVVVLAEGGQGSDAVPNSEVRRVLPSQASASTVWDAMAACLAQDDPHAVAAVATPAQGLAADAAPQAIDFDEGLRLSEGKADVYRHVLQQFEELRPQTLAQLGSRDLPSLSRALHLLKAQAQSLGAHRLQALAAGAEQQLSALSAEADSDPTLALQERVGDLVRDLVQELDRVCQALPALRARLAPAQREGDSAPDAVSGGASSTVLALEQALEQGDVEALNLANRHQALLQQMLGEQATALHEALASYDFDAALSVLRQAVKARD